MKRNVMRIALLLFCALLLLTGCKRNQQPASNDSNEQILAELEAIKQQLNDTKSELAAAVNEPKQDNVVSAPVVTTTPEPVVVQKEVPVAMIFGVNCTVNGVEGVEINGQTVVRVVANKVDGYEFDHWEINDRIDDQSGAEATFTFSEATVISAVYHKHRVVKFINCWMRFLASNGEPTGDRYTEFDFENDYRNPVTGETVEGGKISFFVIADLPQGREVDYWLINGVKYQAPNNAYKFRVEEQDEATVYEVVLKKKSKTPLG